MPVNGITLRPWRVPYDTMTLRVKNTLVKSVNSATEYAAGNHVVKTVSTVRYDLKI